MQAVSQLSFSQAPHGFGTLYHGFPALLSPSNCLKTAKLHRLQNNPSILLCMATQTDTSMYRYYDYDALRMNRD